MSKSEMISKQKQDVSPSRFSDVVTSEKCQEYILNTLRDPAWAARYTSMIMSYVSNTPALQVCTSMSLLACSLQAEVLHLSPGLGQCYLVPFSSVVKDAAGHCIYEVDAAGKALLDENGRKIYRKVSKAQLVVGYKGLIQFAIRSGLYKSINVMELKEGEVISYDPLTQTLNANFIEDWDMREKEKTAGYYACFELLNGYCHSMYWPARQMIAHAEKYVQGFSASLYKQYAEGTLPERSRWQCQGLWYKQFDEMAKKTMLRQLLLKWGTLSPDADLALEMDGSVLDMENGKISPVPVEGTVSPVPAADDNKPLEAPVADVEAISLDDVAVDEEGKKK